MRRVLIIAALLCVVSTALADTKQQRGSLLGIGLPGRVWLAEPDGGLANTDRMSLVYYSSWTAPATTAVTAVDIADLGAVNTVVQARFGTLAIPITSIQRSAVWVPGAPAAVPIFMYDFRRRRVQHAAGP